MADIIISCGGRLDFPKEKRGDSFEGQQYQFQNPGGGHTSLAGATIRCQFRLFNKDGNLIKTITNGAGITVSDAVNAIIIIDPFKIDRTIFDAKQHWYDIQVTYDPLVTEISPKTWIEGIFNVIQDVTTSENL